MRSVEHDDFDLDFSDEEMIDDTVDDFEPGPIVATLGPVLSHVRRGSRDFVGHIVEDSHGRVWMINPHEMIPTRFLGFDLISRDSFVVDGYDYELVGNHDDLVREFAECDLTLAMISNTPVLFTSVEH